MSSELMSLVWKLKSEHLSPDHKMMLMWIADSGAGVLHMWHFERLMADCWFNDRQHADSVLSHLISLDLLERNRSGWHLSPAYFPDGLNPHDELLINAPPAPISDFERTRAQFGHVRNELYRDLVDQFGEYCLKCGSTDRLSVDHVLPISRGGTNDLDNLQILCRSCNSSKGTRTVDYREMK